MNLLSLPYTINGDEPNIVGKICTNFVLQHFYINGQITDQVNVAYLRFDTQWHRLYFECATVFWRTSEAPETPVNSDLASGLLLNDLSDISTAVGNTLESIKYIPTKAGDVTVILEFPNKDCLNFEYSAARGATLFTSTSKLT